MAEARIWLGAGPVEGRSLELSEPRVVIGGIKVLCLLAVPLQAFTVPLMFLQFLSFNIVFSRVKLSYNP